MLQEQADTSDSNPAAETHKERFAACFPSFTMLVLRPMAAMASTMKNLESSLIGAKKSAGTPIEAAMVVMMEAAMK